MDDLDSFVMPANVSLFDLNSRDGCFGPEVGFAQRFLELMPLDELWLIKYAVGGSSLLAWERDWSAERAAIADDADKGALYPRLIRHVKQVTAGRDVNLLACLWMQGESDSQFELAASQYQRNLTRLIADLREDLSRPALRFVIGLVNPTPARFVHLSTVRAAQRHVAQTTPNVSLVDTDGLSKHEDDVHYDSAGQLELGRRFAQQLCRDFRHKSAGRAAD
ncbi:MAG: hypothetical protein OXG84_00050 [Chloroflexi bacterium]|nr:hypothetical protein [Chloroflexota bacterium]